MTERYQFSMDRQLAPNISVDGSVVWSQSAMDGLNSTLSDTMNEGYVTAEDENTQYLSVLDSTSGITLDNLNITLTNPKLEVDEPVEAFISNETITEQAEEEITEQQVVVYTMEGSDELFGIQVAQDEDGNLQKYQFQFRKNEDGQLEAIPETIQLLPMDEVVQEEIAEQVLEQVEGDNLDEDVAARIFVNEDNSHEHILPDSEIADQVAQEIDEAPADYEDPVDEVEEAVDVKPGILALQNVKQEIHDSQIDDYDASDQQMTEEIAEQFDTDLEPPTPFTVHIKQQHFEEDESNSIQYIQHETEDNPLLSTENSNASEPHEAESEINVDYSGNFEEASQQYAQALHDEAVEDVYEHNVVNHNLGLINTEENESHLEADQESANVVINDDNINNDSDAEDYQIVEGLHITGDMEEGEDTDGVALHNFENIHQAVVVNQEKAPPVITTTNILRNTLRSKELRAKKDNSNRVYLYVVQHPEKENVEALPIEATNAAYKPPLKANPRSILKSSHSMLLAKNQNDNLMQQQEKLNSRRFARGKEAIQARMFNNFISKTTIPQAPVRKDRLPRKQKIKPVERMDEEIVVQEMMVSSNGFVEAVGYDKENLHVTDYVELTDSDEDYDPKKINRLKKKHKKRIEITISDSESSNDSVIELDSDDEDISDKSKEREQEVPQSPQNIRNSNVESSPAKRRRGRPPKNRKSTETNNASHNNLESPLKKMRLEQDSNTSEKVEIPCPKCDKSFPSQNSLKTHLQHHNLQSSLKNATLEKYKCNDCETIFKNNALLSRHNCSKKYECNICKKRFGDKTSLNIHKRIHAKEQLIKSTIVPIHVSPKKIKSTASISVFKSPKKVAGSFKCKTCGKLCSSLLNLNIHMKTHKKEFSCGTCSSAFASKLALETHIRESCMKPPQNQRRSMRIKSLGSSSEDDSTRISMQMPCEQCGKQFNTHKGLFHHKVKEHGLDTPDKKAILDEGVKKSLVKTRPAHSGVPCTTRLKKAFADLQTAVKLGDMSDAKK